MGSSEGRDDRLKGVLSEVSDLYGKSLRDHGLAPMAVGWRSSEDQLLRFEKLAQVLDPRPGNADEVTVNDWGCGYGAMFGFLDGLDGFRLGRYVGYEINPEMAAAARDHLNDPRAEIVESGEVTTEADYTFVSGTFNVKLEAAADTWKRWMKDTLVALAGRTRRGLAFNVFTTHVDWMEDHLFYADPMEFFDFARTELGRRVSLIHDYRLYEWTMLVRLDHP